MTNLRPYTVVALVFLAAFVVRIALEPIPFYRAQTFPLERVSYDGYRNVAENILAGNGFTLSNPNPAPDSERTPLYPLFIAGLFKVFGDYRVLFLIQAILGSIAAVFVYLIAKEFLPPPWSLAAGFLFALEPYGAYLAGVIFSETLFTVLFFPAVFFLLTYLRKRSLPLLALAALLLGLAVLVRPIVQYLPLALLIILWLSNERRFNTVFFTHSALLLGVFLIVVSPWLVRTYMVFDAVRLSDSPVRNLYAFLAPSTIAFENKISYEEAARPYFAKYGPLVDAIDVERAQDMRKIALATIKDHPVGLVKSVAVTQWAFFTNNAYGSMLTNLGYQISFAHPPLSTLFTDPKAALSYLMGVVRSSTMIPIIGTIFWIVMSALAVLGAVMWMILRPWTPQFFLIAGIIAYFALTTAVIGLAVNGRFRVPANPFIFILALYALQTIFHKRPDGPKPI